MSYSISCVLIIPAAMRAAANAVIEGYDFGPNNLSVALTKTADASAWYGCHIWCDQAFVDFINSRQAVDFLGKMVVAANAGPANAHWIATLAAAGMTVN